METFCVEIPANNSEKMGDFQAMMNEIHDATMDYISKLAVELGVDEVCAAEVWYLRSRSRHTEALEAELICLHRAGTPPNLCDFGVTTS